VNEQLLAVSGLACRRGPSLLFADVSFAIEAGTALCVRGANGSGKTTLLRTVCGLTRADAGDVQWRGAARDELFRGELLYAGHAPAVKDDLSAEENLDAALGLAGTRVGRERLHSALTEVGLYTRRHLPARRLSQGQRRRIALARLMLDPALFWVLDEPLTALDDAAQALLLGTLDAHLARGGAALLATHHDLPVAGDGRLRQLRLGD
jgi:heme exporter protein A